MNQSQFEYNDFGQLTTESHSGAVNVSATPKVEYGYADGSANTIRPTALTYPNDRELTYDYGTSGGISDRTSRIDSIVDDDDTHLVDYQYLGRQSFVEQECRSACHEVDAHQSIRHERPRHRRHL